jgi:DNA polymerase
MQDAESEGALTALLDWYREMGAEEAVGETAIDWLRRGEAPPGKEFSRQLKTPFTPSGPPLSPPARPPGALPAIPSDGAGSSRLGGTHGCP